MPRVTITQPEIGPQPYRFDLDRKVVKIGRHDENDIKLTCGSTSSYHAEMCRVDGGYELQDKDSTNGISFEGETMKTIELLDGRTAKLGDVEFHFTLTDEEQDELANEKKAAPEKKAARKVTVKKLTTVPKADGPYSPPVAARPQSAGAGGFLLFIVLTVFSVVAGLGIAHYQKTGNFFLNDFAPKKAATK